MLSALRKILLPPPAPTAVTTACDRIKDLPGELQLEIAQYLSPADLLRLSMTSKAYAHFREDTLFRDRYLTHPWYEANPQRASEGKNYFQRFRDQANYDLRRLKAASRALGALCAPQIYVSPRAPMAYAMMAQSPAVAARKRALKHEIGHWQRTVAVARGGRPAKS